MWETFHIGQLLPFIDSRFRTVRSRRGRAIAGISMGGFGALSYAGRHPRLFGFAASYSGVVDTNYGPFVDDLEGVAETSAGEPAIWGPRSTEQARWRAHNPWDLAPNLRNVRVQLFTGDGRAGGPYGGGPDKLEQTVYAMNLSLHQRLLELGIDHGWGYYGPGTHSMLYARRDLSEMLPALMAYFARALREGKGETKRAKQAYGRSEKGG
jgi:S-formylglutathione hydrolase FrmB